MRDLDPGLRVAKSLKSTHQTQIVSYGSPSCVRSCRDIPLDPKDLIEECDTAIKVRQSARDIVASHRNRPTVKYATLAKKSGLSVLEPPLRTAPDENGLPFPIATASEPIEVHSLSLCASLVWFSRLYSSKEAFRYRLTREAVQLYVWICAWDKSGRSSKTKCSTSKSTPSSTMKGLDLIILRRV